MPLGGHVQPEDVAEVHTWSVSPANRLMTGQVHFVDGEAHAVLCGDEVF